jgi:hypothetical protein
MLWLTLICLLAAGWSQAANVVLLLNPPGGTLLILPGQTSGWGFTLDNQTADWISVTGSALTFESNPSLGVYTDFIGLQGGPLPSFALAPFSSWSEVFDGVSEGVGSYTAFLTAGPFAEDRGFVQVNFDIFSDDPFNGGAQTGSSSASAPFVIDIGTPPSADVPEPSTMALSALTLMVCAWRRLRIRRCCNVDSPARDGAVETGIRE